MATSRGVLGSLQVCTAGGREILHPLSSTLTVAQLKGNLRARLETPVAYLRLLHGMEELLDDWVLMEHGVSNGAILTQVTSWLPFGLFGFDSHHQNFCPAGRNTTATVHVDIRDDGTFHIRVMETEITSLMQGPDWDPYLEGAAFSQQYEGSVRVGEGSQLIFSVSHCDRRGIFVVEEPIELRGELCQDASAVKLEIPFAAGACNEGRAGSKWLTVSQNHVPQIDDSPDSSLRARRFLRLPATPQQSRLRRVLSRAFGCFSRPEMMNSCDFPSGLVSGLFKNYRW